MTLRYYLQAIPTGEYKVWMTPVGDYSLAASGNVHGFLHSKSKTDNFRIRTNPSCAPGFGTFPNCFAAMPVTKTLNGSAVPTDLNNNPLIQFTFNLYLQNRVPLSPSGQIVPLGYALTPPPSGGLLASVNFPPDPGLLAPWGVPLSLCDMGSANASPANGTGTFGSLTVTWTVKVNGVTYLNLNTVVIPPNTGAVSVPYDPSSFISGQPHASCINFTVPAGTAEFRIDVNNIAPNTGRMNGGGTVLTIQGDTPSAGTPVTHTGTVLQCNPATTPNNMKVTLGQGQSAPKFELVTLTFAACLDTSIVQPSSASFDTYIGVGTGTFNNAPGYTATWKFTDAGNPGTNDQATIIITDSNSNTVVNVGPANLIQPGGNQNAH